MGQQVSLHLLSLRNRWGYFSLHDFVTWKNLSSFYHVYWRLFFKWVREFAHSESRILKMLRCFVLQSPATRGQQHPPSHISHVPLSILTQQGTLNLRSSWNVFVYMTRCERTLSLANMQIPFLCLLVRSLVRTLPPLHWYSTVPPDQSLTCPVHPRGCQIHPGHNSSHSRCNL